MRRNDTDRLAYRKTQEFIDGYREYKLKYRISDDDDSYIGLFGSIFLMKKLPELNPYYAYRYNKKDDNKVEMV